jgi:hypothetical protein
MGNAQDHHIVVVVSDLHVGSTAGLWPPGFTTKPTEEGKPTEYNDDAATFEGNVIHQNGVQKLLWSGWDHLANEFLPSRLGDDPYILVINGDVIDGVHHRSKEVMSAEEDDHINAAVAVYNHLPAPALTYVIEGTNAHTKNHEHVFGARIGAVQDPTTRRHAFRWLPLMIHGCPCSFQHHMPTTSRRWLESGGPGRELHNERLSHLRNGFEPLPRFFARAHRHLGGYWEDADCGIVITGGWQADTRWVRQAVRNATLEPSAVVLDWRGRDEGNLPAVEMQRYKFESRGYVYA